MKKLTVLGLLFFLLIMLSCKKETEMSEVNFSSMWNPGEPEMLFLTEVATEFEQQTRIKVNFTWAGRDVLNKLRTNFLSNDAPDLLDQGWSDIIAALVTGQEEMLLDLADVYQQSPPGEQTPLTELIDQKIVDLYRIGGKIYFFPLKLVTSGFFYDKTLFEKYGVAAPTTWEEFIEVSTALKEANLPPLALDGNIGAYNAYYLYWAIQRVMGDGAFERAARDQSGELWKEAGYLRAAQMIYQLSAGGLDFFQPGYQGANWPAAQSEWALNGSGSVLVGSWIAAETKKQQTSTFRVGFYPFPTVTEGLGQRSEVEILPYGFAIPKAAKNPQGAKQFLVYLMSKDRQNKFVTMTDNFSSRKDIDYPELLSDLKPYLEQATRYHTIYDNVQQSYPEWFARIFYELNNKLTFGAITPEEFIAQIAQQSNQFWQQKG